MKKKKKFSLSLLRRRERISSAAKHTLLMLDLQREEEKKSPLIIRGELSLINELNFVFRHYTLWSGINEKRNLRFEGKFF